MRQNNFSALMKPKIKIIFISFLLTFLLFANLTSAALVNCGGYNPDRTPQAPCTIGNLIGTIQLVINFLLSWAWLISILLIVISGFRMVFSAGNEERVSQARTSLSQAILGFIIILISFVMLNLVIGLLTGNFDFNALKNTFDLVQ